LLISKQYMKKTTKHNIIQKHELIQSLICDKEIKSACDHLTEFLDLSGFSEYRDILNRHILTYKNMLKFSVFGTEDPLRDSIFHKLQLHLLELSDLAKSKLFDLQEELTIMQRKKDHDFRKELNEDDYDILLNALIIDTQLSALLKDSNIVESTDKKNQNDILFLRFLLTTKLKTGEISFLDKAMHGEHSPWYFKCLIVTALSLGNLLFFDVKKILFLYQFYQQKEPEIWQRALVGLIINFYHYDKRLSLYPEILSVIDEILSQNDTQKHIQDIIIQLLRAKETEKVSKKLREEIIPELVKIKPKLDEKLNLDEILSENIAEDEDKNEKWKNFLKDDQALYDKIEELSKMQMEGTDVFMSAFSMLKHFPFFQDISNWFLPFFRENEILEEFMNKEKDLYDRGRFISALYNSPFLCNSDKYSFCFNLQHMPDAQKSQIMHLFIEELESLHELENEDKKLDKADSNKIIYTRYIQDLYRFFKLHPMKEQFVDIFCLELHFFKQELFRKIIQDKKLLRQIAEFYFDKTHYESAIELFLYLEKTEKDKAEIFEKIAYAYQNKGNYQKALDFYHKAELYDTNKNWILKKIALCYRKLKNNEKALEYYLELLRSDNENLYLCAQIGHCYLDLQDFPSALKYYFKVEYLSPGNLKVLRPIAYCYFREENYAAARKSYLKFISKEGNSFDYIHIGHIELLDNNMEKALEYYKKAIEKNGNSIELFIQEFQEDLAILRKKKSETEIQFILDYLRFEKSGEEV
jgi:tetratricopeptide (TPR) repeat protein